MKKPLIFLCFLLLSHLASAEVPKAVKTNPADGDKLEFDLLDCFGRRVTSQDYKGVPIFLEFGACW